MGQRRAQLLPLQLPGQSWWLLFASELVFSAAFAIGTLAKIYGSPGPDDIWMKAIVAAPTTAQTRLAALFDGLFSLPGQAIVVLVAVLFVALIMRSPLRSLAFGSMVWVGWLSSQIGQDMIHRPRPPALPTVVVSPDVMDSFPSGHTAMATALVWAGVLVLARTPAQRLITGLVGTALVLAVAYSRLYLSMNHPSDIIGALLMSTAGMFFWLAVWNKLIEPALRRSSLLTRAGRKVRVATGPTLRAAPED
ncbi:phosphatase PAP2 family protein [Arthrobacter sp. NPDC056691]|uniref:phosphatase PAP2 family protein n=1 Tax=Arthrobacter sp. NPDC056691 TaxID=3345913 RepID=UPI00367063AD